MPRNLQTLEKRVREIARAFVDKMLTHDSEIDFASNIAFYYPLHVIMDVIGVPAVDEPKMRQLTQELFGNADPELNRTGKETTSPEEQAAMLGAAVQDFHEYFSAMSEDRQKNPKEDLATIIANGEIDGEPLKSADAMGLYIIAATAGHDTTAAATASGMIELTSNAKTLDALKENPAAISTFVDESIRWETPVKRFLRTATEETEIGGQKICKDDYIYVSYVSANRDESFFSDPFTFDRTRKPNKQIAFG